MDIILVSPSLDSNFTRVQQLALAIHIPTNQLQIKSNASTKRFLLHYAKMHTKLTKMHFIAICDASFQEFRISRALSFP